GPGSGAAHGLRAPGGRAARHGLARRPALPRRGVAAEPEEAGDGGGVAVSATTTASPGVRTLLPGQDPEGNYLLAVLLKRSYRIVPDGPCVRAEADRPLLGGDKHHGDPLNSTVKFEADFLPYKPATDVVLNGSAYAPGGRPQRELLASLEVGEAKKV